MPENTGDFALVVGIDDYPKYRPLRGAIEDAKEFASWLCDPSTGGGLPEANCRRVLSTPSPLQPYQSDIDAKLDEIISQLGSSDGRRFYFYFSGHGLAESRLANDLCLARWSERWRNLALDSFDYLELVLGLGKFEQVVFLMDCCRVRMVSAHGLRCSLGFPRPGDKAGSTRKFVAYATEAFNSAYEAAMASQGSGPQMPLVRGYFTRALLTGLRGGAASTEGGVSPERLKAYLEAETPRLAKAGGHDQKPEVDNGLPAAGPTLFGSAVRSQVKVVIRFRNGMRGKVVMEGPDLSIIRQDDASTGPWDLYLDPGLYMLREEEGRKAEVRVRATDEVQDVEF